MRVEISPPSLFPARIHSSLTATAASRKCKWIRRNVLRKFLNIIFRCAILEIKPHYCSWRRRVVTFFLDYGFVVRRNGQKLPNSVCITSDKCVDTYSDRQTSHTKYEIAFMHSHGDSIKFSPTICRRDLLSSNQIPRIYSHYIPRPSLDTLTLCARETETPNVANPVIHCAHVGDQTGMTYFHLYWRRHGTISAIYSLLCVCQVAFTHRLAESMLWLMQIDRLFCSFRHLPCWLTVEVILLKPHVIYHK